VFSITIDLHNWCSGLPNNTLHVVVVVVVVVVAVVMKNDGEKFSVVAVKTATK
jgi:hypothetical protein